jgi:hypothetical protein
VDTIFVHRKWARKWSREERQDHKHRFGKRAPRLEGNFWLRSDQGRSHRPHEGPRAELGPHGINVNCVVPGLTKTPASDRTTPEMYEVVAKLNPLQRVWRPRRPCRSRCLLRVLRLVITSLGQRYPWTAASSMSFPSEKGRVVGRDHL